MSKSQLAATAALLMVCGAALAVTVRWRLAVAETVGQKADRAWLTSARASSKAAAAALTFSFEMSICRSSSSSAASLKIRHQGPLLPASPGSLGFQPSCSL